MQQLDGVFGQEEAGYCYGRYDNPSAAALEEVVTELENGHGSLACGSGMAALHMALITALADRRKSVVAADALYGASVNLLMNVLRADRRQSCVSMNVCDLDALGAAVAEAKPGLHFHRDHLESTVAR